MANRPQRRAKGSGSIRKRGAASWELRYEGPMVDGERKTIYESVRGSRAQADRALRERLAQVEQGSYLPRSSQTVAEFMQKWLDTYVATNTSARTQQGYAYYIRRHIGPTLGMVRLQGLTAPQIQAMYGSMKEQGLSNQTVLHCHRIFKQALGYAVKWGDLKINPADAATAPRPEKTQLETWEGGTFQKFLTFAEGSQFRELYHLAALTGMRRSELCGLKWEDIDLDNGSLRVVRTLQRLDGLGLVEGRPKTDKLRRTLVLSPTAIATMRRVRACQNENRLRLGDIWQGRGHVFSNENGTPISGERVSKDFAKIVKRNDLPHIPLHGLRHTAASLMIAGGVHARTIADILGHSSISTTMDVYGHLISGVQQGAVSVLDAALNKTS